MRKNTREKRENHTNELQPQEANINVKTKKRTLAVLRDEIAAAVNNEACLVTNVT